MAAMDELHNCFVSANTQKLWTEIIYILQSHYPPSGNVQVILLKFKMATKSRLFIPRPTKWGRGYWRRLGCLSIQPAVRRPHFHFHSRTL